MLYILAVWFHIVAAALWIGGMLFLVLVLMPVVRQQPSRQEAAALTRLVGRRFRWVGWAALVLLIVSGTANLVLRGITWSTFVDPQFWRGSFGRVLGLKLALVAVTVAASIIHDWAVGPRATAAWQRLGAGADPEHAQRLRRRALWIGRLNLVIGLVIVALGVVLVRGLPR